MHRVWAPRLRRRGRKAGVVRLPGVSRRHEAPVSLTPRRDRFEHRLVGGFEKVRDLVDAEESIDSSRRRKIRFRGLVGRVGGRLVATTADGCATEREHRTAERPVGYLGETHIHRQRPTQNADATASDVQRPSVLAEEVAEPKEEKRDPQRGSARRGLARRNWSGSKPSVCTLGVGEELVKFLSREAGEFLAVERPYHRFVSVASVPLSFAGLVNLGRTEVKLTDNR
jgi:hypothetical protein